MNSFIMEQLRNLRKNGQNVLMQRHSIKLVGPWELENYFSHHTTVRLPYVSSAFIDNIIIERLETLHDYTSSQWMLLIQYLIL